MDKKIRSQFEILVTALHRPPGRCVLFIRAGEPKSDRQDSTPFQPSPHEKRSDSYWDVAEAAGTAEMGAQRTADSG